MTSSKQDIINNQILIARVAAARAELKAFQKNPKPIVSALAKHTRTFAQYEEDQQRAKARATKHVHSIRDVVEISTDSEFGSDVRVPSRRDGDADVSAKYSVRSTNGSRR